LLSEEVEVARKRIALTLRLDDETGGKKKAQGSSRDGSRTFTKASHRSAVQSSDGALAEALRRAGEKSNRGRKRS
jgi:protein Tex